MHQNRLIQETSPYLLQHAHNPVDWYPWGEEAFEKARKENKPVLVSIGYSTCHWCHVMERESFENERVAAYMNEHFVNIKVDREERPDIDSIYMEAVQVMSSGSGGWPLNCFLLPDGKPFFGGTYFPPVNAHRRASWSQVLTSILDAFHNKKGEVEEQAAKILSYVQGSDKHFVAEIGAELKEKQTFSANYLQETYYKLRNNFDGAEGGFGHAPKFPSTMALRFCLNYHYFTKFPEALAHLQLSLNGMIRGGIYDQVGGGFSRYSVDREWLVPHFEKMLYDNALLVGLLADSYSHDPKDLYAETIRETLDWVKREMTNEEGGFYSALDADSEGVEGKYYVWSKSEVVDVLGDDAELFSAFYDITEAGNWEHQNIPRRLKSFEQFATENKLEIAALKTKFEKLRAILFEHREKRIRPGLDDKVLLDWNAMMITAHCKAYKALQVEEYKTIALRATHFLLDKFQQANSPYLFRSYKNGIAKQDAFLDDYALLIEALLEVYSIDFDPKWIEAAEKLTKLVLTEFSADSTDGLFYFTKAAQTDLIVRKKELYDNATPSGNSTMLHNLQHLAVILDRPAYRQQAEQMLLSLRKSIQKYPQSFSRWANALFAEVYSMQEIAVVGPDYAERSAQIQQQFIPHALLMASASSNPALPLLAGRDTGKQTQIFVCSGYACKLPVTTVEKMLELI